MLSALDPGGWSVLAKQCCGNENEAILTTLSPAGKVVRSTFRHPPVLAVAVNIAIDDLGKFHRRVEAH